MPAHTHTQTERKRRILESVKERGVECAKERDYGSRVEDF